MKNIILIGLPSCGKTYFGKRISEAAGLNFIDLDDYIVEKNNMSIDEMFNISENFFRDRESEAVVRMAKCKDTVIATGGGVIKRKENMEILSKSGTIIFIDRRPENIIASLDTSTRPLLKDGRENIYDLYRERYELYKRYADIIIDNNDSKEKVISSLEDIIRNQIDIRTMGP